MPAARPSEVAYPSWAEIADKWLLFNEHAWCVCSMPASELERMVAGLATRSLRTELMLDTITEYASKHSRWYLTAELERQGLLTLYDTQQEAQQALLPPPVMLKPKRVRKSRKAS